MKKSREKFEFNVYPAMDVSKQFRFCFSRIKKEFTSLFIAMKGSISSTPSTSRRKITFTYKKKETLLRIVNPEIRGKAETHIFGIN